MCIIFIRLCRIFILRSKIIVFEFLLTTFEVGPVLESGLNIGSSLRPNHHKQCDVSLSFTTICPNPWKALYCRRKSTVNPMNSFVVDRGEDNVDIHMDRYLHLVVSAVRFPMMCPNQLADLLLYKPVSKSHTDILVSQCFPNFLESGIGQKNRTDQ